MEKNILHLLGHPSENTACKGLLEAYQQDSEGEGNSQVLHLSNLKFNVNLSDGYKTSEVMQLEEDLVTSKQSMRIMVTMGTPKWWFYLINQTSQYQILKRMVFGYVGFDPFAFPPLGSSENQQTNGGLKGPDSQGIGHTALKISLIHYSTIKIKHYDTFD